MNLLFAFLAAVLLTDGNLTIEGEKQIDPAYQIEITVTPAGIDLRERFRGFSVANDYEDEKTGTTHWLLTPKPCEESYSIAPFAFEGRVVGPVYFDNPPPREPVTGAMEVEVSKDLPPLSWKLVGEIVALVVALALVIALLVIDVRYLSRRIKEHRMSPIERAWVELDRLIKKGLPGRGRYKDFYVELTMVVRRYVQRKYGIKAPNLTTEEFLKEFKGDGLKEFLEAADMVKFAGIEATPEMADAATESARDYLKGDSAMPTATAEEVKQ